MQNISLEQVTCRGGGVCGPLLSSLLVSKFFQRFTPLGVGIILRHPFLAEQHQKFSKGAFDANITNFEGERPPLAIKISTIKCI